MNAPVSTRTPLVRLVDALTTSGRALLLGLEQDRAALAMPPAGVLLVVLDGEENVATRVATALHAEAPDVIEGLAKELVVVVLLGTSAGIDELLALPHRISTIDRAAHWIAVAPHGAMTIDDRAIEGFPHRLLDAIDRTIEEALAQSAPSTAEEARVLADRFGERPLAEESRLREGATRAPRPRAATIGLIIACCVMYAVQLGLVTDPSRGSLVDAGALLGSRVLEGHPELLLSYAFLHGGIMHILMNMSALYAVGSVLEGFVGSRRMLVVFTLSVLGGGLALVVMKPEQLVVGASGGIFGVMTALYGISLRSDDLPPLARGRLRKSLGTTLLLNLFISLLPNVSLLGHAGGAIVGIALGASGVLTRGANVPWRRTEGAPRAGGPAFTVAAIVCVVALASSVIIAIARGHT